LPKRGAREVVALSGARVEEARKTDSEMEGDESGYYLRHQLHFPGRKY